VFFNVVHFQFVIILTDKARTYLSGALFLFYPKKFDKTMPWREKKRTERQREKKGRE
jgi:hypothetical protein